MANTPDMTECAACRRQGDARLPIDPWRSLAVHFGMLLGAADFQTIDAYHRGKMWLHAAWLHRQGVVWGLRPSLVEGPGELRIEAGLAIDGCGRELHLDRPACIDLGKWFAARAEQFLAEQTEIEVEQLDDGRVRFDARVSMRFVGCLERQVPALLDPCDGAGRTTAYSRIVETVELALEPGLPEPIPPAYPHLRLLFGLDPLELAADERSVVEDARAAIASLPIADQPAALEREFRRFAALDAAALAPALDAQASPTLLPAIDPAAIVLAELRGLTLRPLAGAWEFDEVQLVWDQRPTHVATRPLQELVAAAAAPQIPSPLGPQVLRATLSIDTNTLKFTTSAPLALASAIKERLQLSGFDPVDGWQPIPITSVVLDSDNTKLSAQYDSLPSSLTHVRLLVDGTSSTPVLGAEGWPLAGADDDPAPSKHAGRDFAHMQRLGE